MNCLKKVGCRVYQKVMYVASPMLKWRKPELLDFPNGVKDLPKFIKEKGLDNILVVTGATISKMGLVDGLFANLQEQGLNYFVFNKMVPNPTIDNIEDGLKMYNDNKCQAIVAFGGGSPMDCAKGIACRIVRPNKTIQQMKGLLKVGKTIPPFFAIPTTAGSGSETTIAAVVSNSITHEKYAINDPVLIPHYAVLDPTLTIGLPKGTTAATGVDALTHAVEAYVGKANTKETKVMAKDAVKLIFDYLPKAYDDGTDIEARANMQKASYFAGVAFTRAYVGNVHAMAHPLGGFYNIAHGYANSVLLPHVLEFYGNSAHKALAELADVAGISNAGDNEDVKAIKFIQAIKDLNKYMGISDKIEGIKEEDITLMSQRACEEANPLYPVPKIMEVEDFEKIYRKIMV